MPRTRKADSDPTKKHRPLSLLLTTQDMAIVEEYARLLSISKAAAARMLIRAGARNLNLDTVPTDPPQ
jgi:hypothetical protein